MFEGTNHSYLKYIHYYDNMNSFSVLFWISHRSMGIKSR